MIYLYRFVKIKIKILLMMQKITILPHPNLCPEGKTFDAKPGQSICSALLDAKIQIEHACEQSCACTTCHVVIRRGFDNLNEASDQEEDLLDKAWGLEPNSRLSCQAVVPKGIDIIIEIPRYSINHAKENEN